jgi:hypothetical protein
MEFAGEFETHLTLEAGTPADVARAERWARDNGLAFTHIELDREATPSQPMVTYHGWGTLSKELENAATWTGLLAEDGLRVVRTKVEASPLNAGVPQTYVQSLRVPPHCYFEHHLELLLPADADLAAIGALVLAHDARLSRNARRVRDDGRQERFVTQRCSRVGQDAADRRLTRLVEALSGHGLAQEEPWRGRPGVVGIEQEFVVHDSALDLDAGWMDAAPVLGRPDRVHRFQRRGEPRLRERHAAACRRALRHVLAAIADSPWSDHLVLRGSAALPLWVGDLARHPHDLDFVVVPEHLHPFTEGADELVRGVLAAIGARRPRVPGLEFGVDHAEVDAIHGYEGVPGLSLLLGWTHPYLPRGHTRIDLAFGEPLPDPPEYAALDGTRIMAATADLSLAWKIQWLYGDDRPQAKDLQDAVLLAESGAVSRDRVFALLSEELGFAAESGDHADLEWCLGREDGTLDRFEEFMAPWFERP